MYKKQHNIYTVNASLTFGKDTRSSILKKQRSKYKIKLKKTPIANLHISIEESDQ